jgi:hypothetical protein
MAQYLCASVLCLRFTRFIAFLFVPRVLMSACHSRYGNYGCPYYNCQDLTKTLNDTVWLATFSHAIAEGGAGERAYTSRSTDEGKTWTMMQPLEASLQLASHGSGFIKGSTAVPLTRNANRVYVVYQYNSDNTTTLPDGTKLNGRTDMLGQGFFFRWCGATPPHSHSHSTHHYPREGLARWSLWLTVCCSPPMAHRQPC